MVLDGVGTPAGVTVPDPIDDDYFPLMDRMGNVTAYKKASTTTPATQLDAIYDYDAFGQEVRSSGPAADVVPYHFSTKFTDATGLVYYGYRWYDAAKGRWLSRDPIGERGGRNLYGMCSNNALDFVDRLGRDPTPTSGGFSFSGHKNADGSADTATDDTFNQMAGGEGVDKHSDTVGNGSTGEDLRDHLKKLTGEACCIKELRLAAHASLQGLGSPNQGRDGFYGFDKKPDKIKPGSKGYHMDDLRGDIKGGGIKFCTPCTIKIHSCGSWNTNEFIINLARETGCTVVGAPNFASCSPPKKGTNSKDDSWRIEDGKEWQQSVGGAPLTPVPGAGNVFDPNKNYWSK